MQELYNQNQLEIYHKDAHKLARPLEAVAIDDYLPADSYALRCKKNQHFFIYEVSFSGWFYVKSDYEFGLVPCRLLQVLQHYLDEIPSRYSTLFVRDLNPVVSTQRPIVKKEKTKSEELPWQDKKKDDDTGLVCYQFINETPSTTTHEPSERTRRAVHAPQTFFTRNASMDNNIKKNQTHLTVLPNNAIPLSQKVDNKMSISYLLNK